jgi:hypothetical protein
MPRELWETVVDLVSALEPAHLAYSGLLLTDATLDLPVDCVFVETNAGFQIRVDAPHARTTAGIERKPTHLRLHLEKRLYEPQ